MPEGLCFGVEGRCEGRGRMMSVPRDHEGGIRGKLGVINRLVIAGECGTHLISIFPRQPGRCSIHSLSIRWRRNHHRQLVSSFTALISPLERSSVCPRNNEEN